YQDRGEGAGVGGVMSGYLLGQLKSKLGPKLPFDLFRADLRSEVEGSNGNTQAEIEVGKYISDKIFVKLRRGFGSEFNEPENALSLDYRLSKRWSLETTQSDQG